MHRNICKSLCHAGLAVAMTMSLNLFGSTALHAEDWANLKGHFIFDGKPPVAAKLEMNKDTEYCGMPPAPVDESVVVNDKGDLANVVVWVRTPRNIKAHPDYDKLKTEKAVIDNSHCRFDPHIVICHVGQDLEVKNADPVSHNTNAALSNGPFNVIVPANTESDRGKLGQFENLPAKITCNIHNWMEGWLVVPPTPYAAVSDKDGKFEIKNLPAGTEIEFQVWHEKPGYVQKAKINDKDAGWAKGRFKMTLKPGDNDLGDIKVTL